jgi:hypothetical protein
MRLLIRAMTVAASKVPVRLTPAPSTDGCPFWSRSRSLMNGTNRS